MTAAPRRTTPHHAARCTTPPLHASSHRERFTACRATGEKLRSPEFAGILDPAHPPCGGNRFASLEGDRVLTIRCDGPATYALDDSPTLHSYSMPVRIEAGPSNRHLITK